MRSRYVVRITPSDVGHRVTIRFRRADAAVGEPSTSDVVGLLRSWSNGRLVVERRDGTLVELAERDLLAARVIPRS